MPNGASWGRRRVLRIGLDDVFDEVRGRSRPRIRWDDEEPQQIPVNVFETENELMVVAPMPGIEPANIEITADDRLLTLRAEKRGPGQEHHRYLVREWSYGPYERRIELPPGVDAQRANASYDNGVITVALPKSGAGKARRIEIELVRSGNAHGEHVGHRGTAEAGKGTKTGPKGEVGTA